MPGSSLFLTSNPLLSRKSIKKYEKALKKHPKNNNKRIQDDFLIFQKAPKGVLRLEYHRGDQFGPSGPKIIDLQNENVFHIIKTLDQ